MGILPNFLIIGAPRAGTTSLNSYLARHPQVYMSERKEIEFFSLEENWAKGPDWYSSHFEGAEGAVAIGEASPQYSFYPFADPAPRIAGLLPDARIVYLVRHPVDRIFSYYNYMIAIGWETAPIREAVAREPSVLMASSSYATQVERYLMHFPRERLLIVNSDDLRDRRRETMASILRFLGVDDSLIPDELEERNALANKRVARSRILDPATLQRVPGYRQAVALLPAGTRRRAARRLTKPARVVEDPELRAELTDRLRDEIVRLAGYMGPGFDGWGMLDRKAPS